MPTWFLFAMAAAAAPLEAWQGGELGNTRMLGMGGAYLAVAEGTRAGLDNPAALAVRSPGAADAWRDVGVTFGIAGLGALSGFQPEALDSDDPERRLRLGSALRLGPVGLGAYAETLGYAFDVDPETPGFERLEHGALSVGAAHAVGGGELVVGVLGVLYFAALTAGEEGLFGRDVDAVALGPGALIGALWAPPGSRWRFGLRARPFASTVPDRTDPALVDVHWPSEVGVGIAWQGGAERNLPATYGVGPPPERGGRYVLLSTDVDVVGPTDATDLRRALGDLPTSGSPTTVAVHVGAEAEVVEHAMAVRLGAYTEPGRPRGEPDRLHGTAGLALFLGRYPLIRGLRVSPTVDLARGWFRFSFGVGPW